MAKGSKKAAAKPSAKKAAPKKPATVKAQKDRGTQPKPPKPPKGKNAPNVAISNSMDPKLREVFLDDVRTYAKKKKALSDAQRAMQAFGKVVKNDGFTMRQIKFAIELETPENEEAARMLLANDLLAARYVGSSLGNHLDVFLDPSDLTPAVDRAYDEGQRASMENRAMKCDYHTGTPQYAAFVKGFQDDTARRVKEGIKAPAEKTLITKDEKAAADKAKLDADAAKERANSPVPSVPKENSRVDELAARRQAKDSANAIFEKPAGNA